MIRFCIYNPVWNKPTQTFDPTHFFAAFPRPPSTQWVVCWNPSNQSQTRPSSPLPTFSPLRQVCTARLVLIRRAVVLVSVPHYLISQWTCSNRVSMRSKPRVAGWLDGEFHSWSWATRNFYAKCYGVLSAMRAIIVIVVSNIIVLVIVKNKLKNKV